MPTTGSFMVQEDIVVLYWKSRTMPTTLIGHVLWHRCRTDRTNQQISDRVRDIIIEDSNLCSDRVAAFKCTEVDEWIWLKYEDSLVSLNEVTTLCKYWDMRDMLKNVSPLVIISCTRGANTSNIERSRRRGLRGVYAGPANLWTFR